MGWGSPNSHSKDSTPGRPATLRGPRKQGGRSHGCVPRRGRWPERGRVGLGLAPSCPCAMPQAGCAWQVWVSRSASRSRSVCRGTSGVWLPGPLSRVVKDATPSGHLPPPTHRCAPLTVSWAEEGFPAPPHPTTPSPELGTSSSPHGGQDSDWALVPGGSQAQTDTLLPQSRGLSAVHGEPGRAALLSASPPSPLGQMLAPHERWPCSTMRGTRTPLRAVPRWPSGSMG